MSNQGHRWNELDVKPCGTEAAYQRHYRRHEQACYPCLQAHARRDNGASGPLVPDPRPARNGLPEPGRYVYGAPRPGRALRALAAAWEQHGMPDDLFEEAS